MGMHGYMTLIATLKFSIIWSMKVWLIGCRPVEMLWTMDPMERCTHPSLSIPNKIFPLYLHTVKASPADQMFSSHQFHHRQSLITVHLFMAMPLQIQSKHT